MAPPTLNNFRSFFSARKKLYGNKLVFWYGVSARNAAQFARGRDRYTLEMLLEGHWTHYQEAQPNGYWPSWQTAVVGFWRAVAQAFAECAFGDVFVYVGREAAVDQRRPACRSCWYEIEKPELLRSKNGAAVPRVETIRMFTQPYQNVHHARLINAQND